MKSQILFAIILLSQSPLYAADMNLKKLGKMKIGSKNSYTKTLRYNFGCGYNMPYNGYDKYLNNPSFSFKIDILKYRNFTRQSSYYRLYLDYFMMYVPEDVYGITEDIVSIGATYLIGLFKGTHAVYPYGGAGLGLYMDSVRLDTPAVKADNVYGFIGANIVAGIEMKISDSVYLIFESAFHTMFSGFPTNLNISASIAFEKQRKRKIKRSRLKR